MSDILGRKGRHIDAVLSGRVSARDTRTGFERVRFVHCALPELDLDAIDLSTQFLGHRLSAPLMVSAMTGGPERAGAINAALAEAAQAHGIALAVGSQRISLTAGASSGLDASLRRRAPTIPIFANIGAVQLVAGFGVDHARRAVDALQADALVLHLNPLQEALQARGDTRWSGVARGIEAVCAALPVPVIAKEVGFGISAAVARRLADAGVQAIDVAGAGGTSWAAVEGALADDREAAGMAELFRDWGIPTADALVDVRRALPGMPLIGSGGIRDGLDVAKAIRLGADVVGQAAALLPAAIAGAAAVGAHLQALHDALRLACFATGAGSIAALRRVALQHGDVDAEA